MADRYDLVEQIDSVARLRKVLLAAEVHLAAVQNYLENLEFEWRHKEGSCYDEN